jgi:hypothetical protein
VTTGRFRFDVLWLRRRNPTASIAEATSDRLVAIGSVRALTDRGRFQPLGRHTLGLEKDPRTLWAALNRDLRRLPKPNLQSPRQRQRVRYPLNSSRNREAMPGR